MSDPLTALRALLPAGARAAGGRIDALQAPLWPEEAAALARARPVRRAEFTAGRAAARRLLGDIALPRDARGLPVWPAGLAGSITHAGGWALAVVSPQARALGLDLERLGADLPLPEIATQSEIARQGAADPVLLFSAKEAAYKAQFPLTGRMLGFHDIEVAFHPGGFAARLVPAAPPLTPGAVIAGRQALADNLVVSLAVIGP